MGRDESVEHIEPLFQKHLHLIIEHTFLFHSGEHLLLFLQSLYIPLQPFVPDFGLAFGYSYPVHCY